MSESKPVAGDEQTTVVSSDGDELAQLNQYMKERDERYNFKLELRKVNQPNVIDQLRLDDNTLKKLDSSIKKVTSFIKRLKTLTESQKDSLGKELKQLNLSKYLSEVANAFLEAKLKMNDLPCALHLCSLMHQSYGEFAPLLFEQWQKILNIKRDEKLANPSKLRVDLRFFAELITIGVLPEKEALSLLGNQLTILTTYDKDHANISIITSFCKHCGEDFADLVPLKFEKIAGKHDMKIGRNNLYSIERQKAVKCLFREYFKSLAQYMIAEHKELQKLDRQNKKLYQTKGEVATEKKDKYDQNLSNFKKLIENAEVLADLLGESMPELPADESNKRDEDLINIDIYTPNKSEEIDLNTSPWEDEDTRQFYECIPDLKSLIPGILYKEVDKNAPTSSETTAAAKPEETVNIETDLNVEMEKIEKELQEIEKQQASSASSSANDEPQQLSTNVDEDKELADDVSSGGANPAGGNQANPSTLSGSNMKALMDLFINQLPNCVNRELIDKAAKEFCMNLNSKTNRKRFINALFQVQRTRLDLLPFYARLVATLNPLMPELSTDLSNLLLNDFRFHVRKKDQINIESKIKTSRFIGELVKFNMFSKLEALNCLKTLLADFRHHNIEMFCNMLDVCGRFLYRNSESHMKLKLLLEILMRKKQAAMSMDSRYTIMIENAFYYCNPPDNKQVEKKVKNPMHEYIKKLLYKDLNKLCVEKILRQMRKLNWNDEEIKNYSIKCLIAAWNVRYNSIHCMANLVSGLALYYDDVGVKVVDGVIEDIQLGMEINLPKFNQRRVSMVKYLGELYNYRMIGSSIIFKTLYSLILYGVVYDVNDAISNNEFLLDPVDNYFRIRLVCILLETCGQYFDRGSTKKKLDCFLVYFQRFYLLKKEISGGKGTSETKPFDPIDVESFYTEVLSSLRCNFKNAKTYKEACERVEKMEEEIKESLAKAVPNFNNLISQRSLAATVAAGDVAVDGLETIQEDDEEKQSQQLQQQQLQQHTDENDEEDGDEADEFNYNEDDDDDDLLESGKRSNANDGDEMQVEDLMPRQRFDSQNQDSNSEIDDNNVMAIIQPRKQEISKEDDEFIKAFDLLVSENIAQRTKEAIKMPTVDLSVPMIPKKIKTSTNPSGITDGPPQNVLKLSDFKSSKPKEEAEVTSSQNAQAKNKGFNFVIVTRKGNKPQYHNMEVPQTSDFAKQFKAREEAERAEKEKLKQLTLNINDRMEQEELQEMFQSANMFVRTASYSQNTNRDRYQKYSHPKGAPDADLIFGTNNQRRQGQGGYNAQMK